MGVRPPSNDVDEEPDVVEFGIAALDARLADAAIEFPVATEELEERFGDATVPYDAAGNEMPLAEALAETDRRSFDSEDDLLNALHPVFERKRRAASTSLLSQLRALVPF
ncbi:DUF5789 family protein [Halosimplex salinum]|uniref:DUF5789 family protein n=1 Tax=Halosimplex salinum TaxID=1710538 RepID=UPI000F478E85|nr:hypothetical protein [Halosimplex salinum]